jgi:hypothetical protein
MGDTQANDVFRGETTNLLSCKGNFPLGSNQSADGAQHRRLSCTIRAEQSNLASYFDSQVDAMQGWSIPVICTESSGIK